MSLRTKIFMGIIATMLIGVVVSVLVSSNQIHNTGIDGLVGKSKAILSRAEAVRDFVANQGGFDLAVTAAVKNYPDGNIPDNVKADILKQVPVFAAMKVA
ncbi:MAG: hypothetical protein ACK5W9_09760, partial [Bdellovibrionales bacterium]